MHCLNNGHVRYPTIYPFDSQYTTGDEKMKAHKIDENEAVVIIDDNDVQNLQTAIDDGERITLAINGLFVTFAGKHELVDECHVCEAPIFEDTETKTYLEFNDGYSMWVCGEWCKDQSIASKKRNS